MAKRKKNASTTPENSLIFKILIVIILTVVFLVFSMRSAVNYSYYSSMPKEDGRSLREQDSFWDHLNKRKVDKVGANYSFDNIPEVGCKAINLYLDKNTPNEENYPLYNEYGVKQVTYYQYPRFVTNNANKRNDNNSFEIWIIVDNKSDIDIKSNVIVFDVSKIDFAIKRHYLLSGEEEFWLTEEQQDELMNFAIDQFKEYQKEYFKVN